MTNLSRRAFLMASGAPFIRSGQQSAIDIPISDKGLPWDPQDPPVTPFRSRPQWGALGLAEVTTDGSAIYAELRYPTEDRRMESLTLVSRAGSELALFLNPLGQRVEILLGLVVTKG